MSEISFYLNGAVLTAHRMADKSDSKVGSRNESKSLKGKKSKDSLASHQGNSKPSSGRNAPRDGPSKSNTPKPSRDGTPKLTTPKPSRGNTPKPCTPKPMPKHQYGKVS